MVIAFLVLPLTLHTPTREALPRKANTAFAGWVADHSALLAELPERTRRLRLVSREALLFTMGHKLLTLDGRGLLPGAKPVPRNARYAVSTDEVDAVRSARQPAWPLVRLAGHTEVQSCRAWESLHDASDTRDLRLLAQR